MSSPTSFEKIIGCTACSRSFAVNPNDSGLICYPAGSAIVLVNPFNQSKINLISPGKCHLTCIAWSPCGQYIATGEFGTDPKVRIWNPLKCITKPECELGWHRLGISCVGFSPDSNLLISVGNNHDKQILIWEWKTKRKLAESRLTCQVNAMAQSTSGKMFVTVGVRHVKFWYLERNNDDNNSILLQGRSAILSEQRNNTFIACCCLPLQRTFVLTLTRLLIEFLDKKLINLYQMGDEIPLAITCSTNFIFIGFWNGTIRILDSSTMELLNELPKPLPLKRYSTTKDYEKMMSIEEELKYPDVHSLVFHSSSNVLSALYSDRSLYHWQLQTSSTTINDEEGQEKEGLLIQNTVKLSSQHFHVGPIFDLETTYCDSSTSNDLFLTAGADETIRFWSLSSSTNIEKINNSSSPELKKVLFLTSENGLLTEQLDKNFGGLLSDSLESTTGIRCLRLSPGGEHLACGRKNGNICIFDLLSTTNPLLVEFEAHEGEVICLDYGNLNSSDFGLILGSASRDRLIHIFDVARGYTHLLTLDEHCGPITTLKFIKPEDSSLLLISYGGDQLLISREIFINSTINNILSTKILVQINKWPLEKTPNCITIRNNSILIGCQNCSICEINPLNGKLLRYFDEKIIFGERKLKQDDDEEEDKQRGEGSSIRITKLCVDPSGTLAAILCSDKSVHLLDLKEEKCGEIDNNSCGGVIGLPSDCVTGLAFLPDCRRLLLVTYSGCIAVWSLSSTLLKNIDSKICSKDQPSSNSNSNNNNIIKSKEQQNQTNLILNNFIEQQTSSSSIIFSLNSSISSSTNIKRNNSTLQEIDDELDSGIGGGEIASTDNSKGGGGGQQKKQQQSFEIKRLNPLDASNLFSKQEGGEQQNESIGGEGVINSSKTIMLSSSSSSSQMNRPPQRPNISSNHQHNNNNNNNTLITPTQQNKAHYFQHNNNNHQPIQHTPQHQQHFSHFPLLYTHPGQQQQQQQQLLNIPLQQHQQQNNNNKNSRSMSNLHSTTGLIGQQQQNKERRKWNIGGGGGITTTNQNQQILLQQQQYHNLQQNGTTYVSSTPSPSMFLSVRPLNQQQPLNNLNNNHQHNFGIPNSVSLNAIRSGIIEKQIPQEYDGNRNSFSRRFLQINNNNIENNNKKDEENNYVWRPNSKSSTMLIKKRRSSNLFNTSGIKGGGGDNNGGELHAPTTNSLLAATSSSPCSSSQASTPSDFQQQQQLNYSPDSNNNFNNNNSSSTSGAARLALNRIKQRRMATALNNNNSDQLPPSSIGRQTPPAPSLPRSRSQSPSQLAMALLASEAAQQTAARAQSPSSRSVLSGSSPSTTSRYPFRLSSNGTGVINNSSSSPSTSKLRQARQRLKKSQENLAGLENENTKLENNAEENDDEPLSRSRSIGNLWMSTNLLNNRRTSLHSNNDERTTKNCREIAKSTTDLLLNQNNLRRKQNEKDGSNNGLSKLGKLAESRQRLAQSIKDIRRISEPEIQPILIVTKEATPVPEPSLTSTSNFRGGLRRGVQKKLDKQWQTNQQQQPLLPPSSARSFQHYNPTDYSSNTETNTPSSSCINKINTTGIRSITSLTPTSTSTNSAHSPRSNYLAQKLSNRISSGINCTDSSSATPLSSFNNKKEFFEGGGGNVRSSFNSELNQASNSLASFNFTSTGSKKMALHAQECIREMQQASDKLLGTRQLINFDPTINPEEKRQLLFNVNKAVSTFSKRLTFDEIEDDNGCSGRTDESKQQERFNNSYDSK